MLSRHHVLLGFWSAEHVNRLLKQVGRARLPMKSFRNELRGQSQVRLAVFACVDGLWRRGVASGGGRWTWLLEVEYCWLQVMPKQSAHVLADCLN